jgi:hypothetical protein
MIAELIYLDKNFGENISDVVNKRCRPFLGKKDFFNNKIRQIENESESKVPMNINLFVNSIVTK